MESPSLKACTISPIYSPLGIALGVNQSSPEYYELLNKLADHNDFSSGIHKAHQQQDYNNITADARDNRLMLWQDPTKPELKIHVFANNIAVVEYELKLDQNLSALQLANECQVKTTQAIADIYPSFIASFTESVAKLNSNRVTLTKQHVDKPKIYWTTQTLLFARHEVQHKAHQALIKNWLKYTDCPDDADKIISGTQSYSLTWLNYVVIDEPLAPDDEHQPTGYAPYLETMILAQYFYTAQENCNTILKQAIDGAYNSKKLNEVSKNLAKSRVLARLHQVDYNEHLKYLKRFKRKLLAKILSGWDFENLIENGQRMIEICSSRLQEEDNKRRERSTVMTDLLLVTLSFFTVFELSLYLTEFSREMMSRPALDYNDETPSFFLKFIAEVDADFMFGFGFLLTFLLIVLYKFIKAK
ncbi:hypothetical protein [Paraglaciecola sp. 2405UD69-4]|uniref:hypothetical protein n=1 Tax=Paraglaciecola sp. 2405UD69-4 TaxID=3391836 RepID=UPI0039C942BD